MSLLLLIGKPIKKYQIYKSPIDANKIAKTSDTGANENFKYLNIYYNISSKVLFNLISKYIYLIKK